MIQKKTVWFPVAEGGQGGYYSQERWVFDDEELNAVINNAFSAGDDFGNRDFIVRNKLQKEFAWLADEPKTKEDYLTSLNIK